MSGHASQIRFRAWVRRAGHPPGRSTSDPKSGRYVKERAGPSGGLWCQKKNVCIRLETWSVHVGCHSTEFFILDPAMDLHAAEAAAEADGVVLVKWDRAPRLAIPSN